MLALVWVIPVMVSLAGVAHSAEPLDPPATAPTGTDFLMKFHIDGFKGESFSLEIERDEVRYRAGLYAREADRPWRRVRVSREKLEWFEHALEEMGVLDWEEDHFCPMLDGIAWRLELRNGRTVASRGANAFPPRFNELQLTIAWLVEARFGIAVEEGDCRDGRRSTDESLEARPPAAERGRKVHTPEGR